MICKDRDMPSRAAVCEWVMRDAMGFRADYEAARAFWFDELFEDIVDLADALLTCKDAFELQKLRSSINEKKWIIARNRAAPKRQDDTHFIKTNDPRERRAHRQRRTAQMAAAAYRAGNRKNYNNMLRKFLNRGGDPTLLRKVIEGNGSLVRGE